MALQPPDRLARLRDAVKNVRSFQTVATKEEVQAFATVIAETAGVLSPSASSDSRSTLLDEFQHLGIGLVSLREALDLTSPIGHAMFALVGVLAEVERAWIVERTRARLRRARAQGRRFGRPPTISDLPRLRRLLSGGVSYRSAAPLLRVSEGTVRLAVCRDPRLRSGPPGPSDRQDGPLSASA